MEILDLSLQETKDFFIHAFKEEMIVPILGSGFTRGVRTQKGGNVPSGADLKVKMIDMINSKTQIGKDELSEDTFSSISEIFQNTFPDPSKDGIIDYYYTNFTRVKIDNPQQLRFLNDIEWPYIYTLNIDTGIEDSKPGQWEVFYPNRKFDERTLNEDCKRLYKIHGDVAMFCKNLDYNEMILTENQYIASLTSNEQFHHLLSSDCGNKNLLYIGCSLDDEIDIKYSVLSDKNRNQKIRDISAIYVTSNELSEYKKAKLKGFNISHIIQLSCLDDYELFYEFLVECYIQSKQTLQRNIDQYRYHELSKLGNDKNLNLNYLADFSQTKDTLPYYYVSSERIKDISLTSDKINVIIGRRFVGKSMLAYGLLEANPNYQRFYISEKETLSETDVIDILHEENSFVIFDSNSLDDKGFINLLKHFEPTKRSIICVFLNSFDDVANLISYHADVVNYAIRPTLKGDLLSHDVQAINEKLNLLGIATFNAHNNLLDNTLRIAHVYNRKILSRYSITTNEELKVIIWLLIKNRLYYEEIVTLGLTKNYKSIVNKFAPLIQEENCKRGEINRHSTIKVICNGKLGLLQILGSYIYPENKSVLGQNSLQMHHNNVCEVLYDILLSYSKIDIDYVKDFLQFDKLNDVFSRIYSGSSISYVASNGTTGKRRFGAASIIYAVYSYEKIKQLKATDPNYWLQRAKSVYISTYKKSNAMNEITEAIDWAKKAEQDSHVRVENGETRYRRTESNALMQIAMLYGRLAKLNSFKDKRINESSLEYYYRVFSDSNNITATSTLLHSSKGTDDFSDFVTQLIENSNCVGSDWDTEKNKLIKIKLTGNM